MRASCVVMAALMLFSNTSAYAEVIGGNAQKMVVNGVHHVAISVPDMEEARRYYIDMLGLQEVSSGSWSKSSQMDTIVGLTGSAGKSMMIAAGNTFIEVFEYDSPDEGDAGDAPRASRLGYTHLCFDVDDVEAIVKRLRAYGITFHSEPQSLFGVTTVYSRDPFGNIVEFQHISQEERVRRLPELRAASKAE